MRYFLHKDKIIWKISETESNLENAIHRAHDTHGIVACLWWRAKKKKDWRWKKVLFHKRAKRYCKRFSSSPTLTVTTNPRKNVGNVGDRCGRGDRGNFCSTRSIRNETQVCLCVLRKLRRVAKHKMENSVEKIISKSKSKYYRLGCRTLPSIIVIDKIVIVL